MASPWWEHHNNAVSVIVPSAKKDMFSSLFVRLFDCLLATFRKTFLTDLHEIFREGWQWANEQMIEFWRRSGSQIRIRIRITGSPDHRIRIHIATLVRRAWAEVCTVPVLLVIIIIIIIKIIILLLDPAMDTVNNTWTIAWSCKVCLGVLCRCIKPYFSDTGLRITLDTNCSGRTNSLLFVYTNQMAA